MEELIKYLEDRIEKNDNVDFVSNKTKELNDFIKELQYLYSKKDYQKVFEIYFKLMGCDNEYYYEIVENKFFDKFNKIKSCSFTELMDALSNLDEKDINKIVLSNSLIADIFGGVKLSVYALKLISFRKEYELVGDINDFYSVLDFFYDSDDKVTAYCKKYFSFYTITNEVYRAWTKNKKKDVKIITSDDTVNDIDSFYDDLDEKAKKYQKEDNKRKVFLIEQNKIYNKLISKLKSNIDDTYLELSNDEIDMLTSQDIVKINTYFLRHNAKIMEDLTNKLNTLNGNNKNKVKIALNNYNLPKLSDDEIDIVLNINDYNTLIKKIDTVYKLFLNLDNNNLMLILTKLSLENINSLLYLINNKIISKEFAIKILANINDDLIYLIKNKYNLYNDMNLNVNYLDELLILEVNNFEEKIELARSYDLDTNNKDIIKLIIQNKFFDALDIWIEMGFIDKLNENILLINGNFYELTMRMLLANNLNLELFNEDNTLNQYILIKEKFITKQEEIESCISNTVDYHITKKNIDENERLVLSSHSLDNYQFDKIRYKINNVNVSINKYKRNKNVFENDIDALLYGSIFNEEQCESIINEFDSKKLVLK